LVKLACTLSFQSAVTRPVLIVAQSQFCAKGMPVRIRHLFGVGTVAAIALGATPAAAVTPVNQADGKALVLIPLTLTKLQDLDFGSVVPSAVSGAVVINATTGARTVIGGVIGVPSDAGFRARFAGGGTPRQQVIVTINPPAQLTSGAGDTLDVLGMTLDGPATRTIDATHAFFVGVGGAIMIAANQPDGIYTAQFDVTANYQ
jgi:hypothetical protein